ncbi:MAG: Alkaline protease secretion ATP-binding protein AprD [Pseudomonadota bacterium]|jgi:ATP-binding cassette subfamily C exporter for protease/lipase
MSTIDNNATPKGVAVPPLRELSTGDIYTAVMKYKSPLGAVAVFSGVINLLYLAPALYMLQIYDRVLTSQSTATLVALTALVFGLFVVTGLLEGVRSGVLARLGEALEDNLSPRVYRAMFTQQLRAPSNQPSQPLWDLQQLRQFFGGPGLQSFLDLPWLPIFLVTIFLLHPVLGWFVLIGASILLVTAVLAEHLARAPLSQANQWSLAAHGAASSQLRNVEVIESLGMLPALAARWRALQAKGRSFQREALTTLAVTSGLTRVLRLMLQSGALGLGAWLAIKGELTPGAMIAAAILATRALAPLEGVLSHWKTFLSAIVSTQRLNRLLADYPEPVRGMEIPKPAGHLTAENIFVAAPTNGKFILKGLSFTLRPKEVLGILGPSAAGKSTLARALVGIWPAQLGTLRFDGSDIRTMDRVAVGSAIGYLPQDIELFSGTVAENIARFSNSNPEEVLEAANACGIHHMILGLPRGYDTPIGELGSMLSGGQRQLIGLARALFQKPSLVVLDEPSANLDDNGRQCLATAIASLRSWNSTLVLISHDPTVLLLTDRVMILQEGQIHALGPSSEVLPFRRALKKEQEHARSH